MRNLDNLTKKELLKLIVKRLDNLAEKEQLKDEIQKLKDTIKFLENRVAILEILNKPWPNNVPHISEPYCTSDPTPWLPKVFGNTDISTAGVTKLNESGTTRLDEATNQLKESVFNIDLHLNKTKRK